MGVTIDNKLKFDKHVENICQKASRKLNAFARLVNTWIYLKDTFSWMPFLILISIIALLFGCFTVVPLKTELTSYKSAV